jgi:hypothetical protein
MPSPVTTKATRALHLTYPPEEMAIVAQQLARQLGHQLVRWWPEAADPYRIWLEVRPTRQGNKSSLFRLTGTLSARNEEHKDQARSEGIGKSRGNAELCTRILLDAVNEEHEDQARSEGIEKSRESDELCARILLDAANLDPRALAPFSHTREIVRGSLLSLQQLVLFKYLKLAMRKG